MRDRPSDHRIQVELSVEPQAVAERPDVEAPFCIALFGDFSARGHRGPVDLSRAMASDVPVLVDRDNLDDVLGRLRPEVRLPLKGERDADVRVQFSTLEDFHPDRLYERLPVFEGVRELRRRLAEPAPHAPAVRELPTNEPPTPVGGNLLDQIVHESATPRAPTPLSPLEGGDLQAYLNRIVAPHVVPPAEPRREAILAELDAAAAAGLRAVLHHPDFQALEALWRGVRLLTQRVESDADVQLYLFDITRAELAADQRESADARSSRLCRLLAEPPGAAPQSRWGVLAGLYSFGPDVPDLELLGRLASVASLVGAPWISAADSRLVGADSIHANTDPTDWIAEPRQEWQAIRRRPEARWLGLAMPRFLLRLPFEGLLDGSAHEDYLWGNPTFACLLLFAQAIAESGRPLHSGMKLEIGELPFAAGQPCIEALLGERAAERILDRGLMPLVGMRDTDRVRLLRFQSIAEPPTPLSLGM